MSKLHELGAWLYLALAVVCAIGYLNTRHTTMFISFWGFVILSKLEQMSAKEGSGLSTPPGSNDSA